MPDEEFLINLSLMALILVPMWMWGLVILPMIVEWDNPESEMRPETREFNRPIRRLLKLTTWIALILATLTFAAIFLKT